MTTAATVRNRRDSRWYHLDGRPCYELPKSTSAGMRAPTLADAKKIGLLPSVTTVLRIVAKPALQDWLIEQAVLAVITSPRKDGESPDQFVNRILQVERVQDKEAEAAAERGRMVHESIADFLIGKPIDPAMEPYINAFEASVKEIGGKVVWTERVLIGAGYAGRADLLLESDHEIVLPDIKTCSTLPEKGSWPEHRMQTAAYAKALGTTGDKRIRTANIYLNTKAPGERRVFTQDNWLDTYQRGFLPVLQYWHWFNNYSLA